MQNESFAMGSDFSRWEQLTQEYCAGIEALRRHEPGASENMARIAREMQKCETCATGTDTSFRNMSSFGQSTLRTELADRRRENRGWIASTWDLFVPRWGERSNCKHSTRV